MTHPEPEEGADEMIGIALRILSDPPSRLTRGRQDQPHVDSGVVSFLPLQRP
jgi:hypothetical protein